MGFGVTYGDVLNVIMQYIPILIVQASPTKPSPLPQGERGLFFREHFTFSY